MTRARKHASQDIPLQNIPIRTEIGRQLRDAFLPPTPAVLVQMDYSDLELRVMAQLEADGCDLSEIFGTKKGP